MPTATQIFVKPVPRNRELGGFGFTPSKPTNTTVQLACEAAVIPIVEEITIPLEDGMVIPMNIDHIIDNSCVFDMNNISRIKVLSREEERELLRMAIEKGDIKARNKIVEHNLRLVAYVAKSYARNEDVFSELYAEGYTVLFHAIERFDLTKETKFSTYATWWLRQSMSKYLQNRTNDGQIHDLEIEHYNRDSFERSEIIRLIKDCLYILTDREADIIKRRFGIDCEEETLDQIGTDYNLSKERIRQVQEKAMEKMQPLLRECI